METTPLITTKEMAGILLPRDQRQRYHLHFSIITPQQDKLKALGDAHVKITEKPLLTKDAYAGEG